jgi:16S rRNA (guanine527-N7)-methyltransferase
VRARGEAEVRASTRFDVAISRATLAPPAWLELGRKLAPEVWVLLAREEPPTNEGATMTLDERYTWPLTQAARRAVRYRQA